MRSDSLKIGVADNSLVISAFVHPGGVSSRALHRMGQDLTLLASEATLAELLVTLTRPKFQRWIRYERRMQLFATYANSVTIVPAASQVRDCRDPKDDKFLDLALSGHADVIVTGDEDLLCLHPWRGIAILSPADYLARVG
jgi:putative PIN family toxin of toxin-antitoxin system